MRIIVTGASGFVGRNVVQKLISTGANVIAVSRKPLDLAGVETIAADLLDPASLVDIVDRAKANHLVHLAWDATPGEFWNSKNNLDWCAASLLLVRAFYDAGGARALLTGSCAEYDWTGEACLSEKSCAQTPSTLYGVAKDSLRRVFLREAEQYNRSAAWARIYWLYGPHEAPRRLVSDVAAALVAGKPAEVSEGLQKRDFLHVADVASALVTILAGEHQGTVDICSGKAVAIRDVVEHLSHALHRLDLVRFGARPTPPNDPPVLYGDPSILHDKLGFSPRYELAEGLTETAFWWRDQHNSGARNG